MSPTICLFVTLMSQIVKNDAKLSGKYADPLTIIGALCNNPSNEIKQGGNNMHKNIRRTLFFALALTMMLSFLPMANADTGFTVTFNPNRTGATVNPGTMITDSEGKLDTLPIPMVNDRTFVGWYTVAAATGGTEITTETVFTADTVIYARWRTPTELSVTVPPRGADGAIYYSFDDETWNGAIPIGRNHNGFATNTRDNNIGTATLVEGVKGGAIKLDGENGLYLGQDLIPDSTNFTVAFWVNPTGPLAPTFSPMFFGARYAANNTGDNPNRWISIIAAAARDNLGGFGMDVRYAGTRPAPGGIERPYNFAVSPLTPDEWQHIVISNNGGAVTIYVDGMPQAMAATNTFAYNIFNAGSKFYLGVTHNAQDGPFPMIVDELYVYNRSLNALDVKRLLEPEFELPTGPATSPTVPAKNADGAYYWSFDSNFGGAANVQVGNGLRGVDTALAGTVEIAQDGIVGGAASFDYFGGLYLGDNLITQDKYTISFWASPKAATNMTSMLYAGDANEYLNFTTRLSTSAGIRARLGTTNRDVAITGTPRGWTHYALVVDGTTATTWVNGFRNTSVTNFHNNLFNSIDDAKFFLGVNFANEAYIGLIDELYIYDGKVLDRDEIMEKALLYAADRGQYITPGANMGYADPPTPGFGSRISVHDPSIRRDSDGTYYIVGTHLASARSNNMLSWSQVYSDGVNSNKTIYPRTGPNSITSIESQISSVVVSGSIGMWAFDVIQLPNGKWYQYYSLNGNGPVLSPSSAIGVAVADNIDGPFETIDTIVRAGAANGGKAMYGGADYNANGFHPNCIDPAPFFDKNGKLWMVYGSWSGGIFILEMDETTGLAIPYAQSALNRENDGYGRKLVAGFHQGIEGPYVIYSPEADYYYMFLSFGGLEADGGYNIRVFRSRNAEGPYEDDRHKDLTRWNGVESAGSAGFIDTDGTVFYHNDRGVKIIGGYRFIGTDFETTLMGTGYLSPGHNSAYRCPDTGRYFLVYHTRFMGSPNNNSGQPGGSGSGHEVRIMEMFINADGWLVAAPFRNDGGTVREFTVPALVGSYKILYHGRDTNTTSRLGTTAFNLNADGSVTNVTGAAAGSWSLSGTNNATIAIDGITYKGVFLRQFDTDQGKWVQTFTALSSDGMAIWGTGVTNAPAYVELFTVTFDPNDGSTPYWSVEVSKGSTVEAPADPVMFGYTFAGWFLDGELYDFDTAITAPISLKAEWDLVPITFLRISYEDAPAAPMMLVSRNTTYDFDVIITAENTLKQGIQWSVNNPALATVDADGAVSIKGSPGNVTLTARAPSGASHSIVLRIP